MEYCETEINGSIAQAIELKDIYGDFIIFYITTFTVMLKYTLQTSKIEYHTNMSSNSLPSRDKWCTQLCDYIRGIILDHSIQQLTHLIPLDSSGLI